MPSVGLSGADARNQFLNLLVTQIKNQNPLEPTSQEDFLMQLSQFSMVEGIEKLNLRFDQMLKVQELTQGAQLVGRNLEYVGNSGIARGTVESARITGGSLVLTINGTSVPIDNVTGVVNSL
jgi:flagellar basal-body rod modification protein FlgD